MTLAAALQIVWLHFLGDFVLQTDKMAMMKSSSNAWLALHVVVYALPFLPMGFEFAFANAAAHFAVDWVTSRATSRLWKAGERHWFFVVIGLDQAIHFTVLFWSYQLICHK